MSPPPGQPSPEKERDAAQAGPAVSPRYLSALFGTAFAALLGFYALLFGLDAAGRLPPPAFANSICVDEKLAFHRGHPVPGATLLVIGSSVAWRHFDGDAVVERNPRAVPLSGAFCGLSANQSVFAANWFLDRQPAVREVLLIASPQDFENCSTVRTALFDSADAASFVSGASPWPFYMRYFAPGSLLRNAAEIGAKRSGENFVDPLVFDRYGSGPLDTARNRETLLYGMVRTLDPACFDAVAGLGERLRREGRRLLVASTPLNPAWKAEGDPEGRTVAEFNRRMQAALAPSGGVFWDGDAAKVVEPDAFFDAIHLRWSAARTYSDALTEALKLGQAAPPRPTLLSEQRTH
ncbi:hypothetical protein CR162_16890 [Pseudoroseomonas rhizosphaerae]|uniref:Uncharacterized protein n=1 Tax=Teichococcus rhizosphaerae TaxID=1335062 RepID=A0A2C7A854_9PROT|nr:hypothetical protein [Pseudoroseomonas rhizosphaerae]PHK93793.1 hypothetical protein CR162_16890 [Pseudoroseomonas rhizosphaerae]